MKSPSPNTHARAPEKREPQDYSALLKTALLEIERMEAELQEVESSRSAPVAVIGLGCRFPGGADSPESYWRSLCDGVDAIREVPPGRWDMEDYGRLGLDEREQSFCRQAGFLEHVDRFDAEFFGISPREARMIDPQQRLLLQVSWEALENAGLPPSVIKGTDTGIFIGVMGMDYSQYLSDHSLIDLHTVTGHALSSSAGRLSYFLGVHGPSLTIDTACSSSLVSVHQACQSLRTKECNLALAGGVNMILTPFNTLAECRARMLSPSGKCRAFDDAADGMVRGEGCGIVILKRLADAVADGDHILGTIYGSALNHDGGSGGLTVPNQLAQEKLFRSALRNAGVKPEQVNYVEAHGTGTSLGDPIEVASLSTVYMRGRPSHHPLIIGSVKTNIGHLEAASGIAGLIKLVLSLHHREIPKHLHLTSPNSRIPWQELSLKVPTDTIPWPAGGERRMGAVSSFGLTGTNAHMIVGEAPGPEPSTDEGTELPWHLLALSAKSERALDELVGRYLEHLRDSGEGLADITYTANRGRAHFPHRLALVTDSREMLLRQLNECVAGGSGPGCFRSQKKAGPEQKTAFLFTGQGSQYRGMCREIYDLHPGFRQILDQAEALLRPVLGTSLLDIIFSNAEQDGRIHETAFTQPALFVVEYALAKLWMSWGINPDIVLGHSVGEYVAACVAGVFSFEDGLMLIAERGRLMQSLPGGKMMAVFAPHKVVAGLLQECDGQVSIAAVNGPANIVVSGPVADLNQIERAAAARGIKTRSLEVSHAFHSLMMQPILHQFKATAERVRYSVPEISIVSNVTGGLVREEMSGPDYWVNHVLATVRFSQGVETLFQEKAAIFLEVGPAPVLLALGKTHEHAPEDGLWLPSVVPHQSNWKTVHEALGKMYAGGKEVNWPGHYQHRRHRKIALPTYPFQEKRYWLKENHPQTRQPLPDKKVVVDFYNAVADSSFFDGLAGNPFLTFGLFPKIVDGFSWVLVQAFPQRYPEYMELALGAQKHLREVLFKDVDFQSRRKVLDIGCGFGSDLITFAEQHQHLRLHGYNISDRQARVAAAKVLERELQHRIAVFNRDSAKDPFPDQYDLVFGLEVAHHVQDKAALFKNISSHMTEGGRLVLADFISNVDSSIDHHESSSFFIKKDEWDQLLTDNGFEITGCIDVSREISNFLYDPQFDEHLKQLEEYGDENVRIAFKSYDQLGRLLHKGLASYVLLTAKKNDRLEKERNRQKLSTLTGYDSATDDLETYTVAWQLQERGVTPPSSERVDERRGTWVVVADEHELVEEITGQLASASQQIIRVYPGRDFRKLDERTYEIGLSRKQDFLNLFRQLSIEEREEVRGVLYLPGTVHEPESLAAPDWSGAPVRVLHLAQAMLESKNTGNAKLWLATRGVQSVDARERSHSFGLTTVWSLSKVIALEHPRLWGGVFDLPRDPVTEDLKLLTRQLQEQNQEDQLVLRDGQLFVQRLKPLELAGSESFSIDPQGSYLITGGFGSLGMHTARWLVGLGVKNLILVSSKGADTADRQAFLEEVKQFEVNLKLFSCDVADPEAMTVLFEDVAKNSPPLKGIFHLAGALDDGVITLQNSERFKKVMAPKVLGAWHLHHLSRDLPLDVFVCFSSMASILGSPGQANYAAANGFLDGLAHYRRALGLPALTINWGQWKETGMAGTLSEKHRSRLSLLGLKPFEVDSGLKVLGAAIQQNNPQVAAAAIDWPRLEAHHAAIPLLSELYGQRVRLPETSDSDSEQAALLRQLKNGGGAGQYEYIRTYLRKTVSAVMDFEEAELDMDRSVIELGIDSLMAVELQNRLTRELGIEMPVTRLMEGVTVTQLAQHIQEALAQSSPSQLPEPAAEAQDTGESITPEQARELLARIDELSEEEAERLLRLMD